MQITRLPNESTADFVARAFRINRQMCSCERCNNPGPARPWLTIGDAFPNAKFVKILIPPQRMLRSTFSASPMPRDAKFDRYPGLRGATRTPAMSRLRAIWYGSGLVFGVVCIAMAVFGMGQ